MAAEYSFVPVQTVAVDENVTFTNGCRACHKGFVQHRDDSGIFFLKGATNGCKAIYRVTFVGNVAAAPAADGGVLEPLSIAITINGEALGNATSYSIRISGKRTFSMFRSRPLLTFRAVAV